MKVNEMQRNTDSTLLWNKSLESSQSQEKENNKSMYENYYLFSFQKYIKKRNIKAEDQTLYHMLQCKRKLFRDYN